MERHMMYLGLANKKQKAQNICSAATESLQSSETETGELERRFIKVGSFYELYHSKLPLKSPEQLYSIRIAMVRDVASHRVSLRFPSVHSLRAHFNDVSQERKLPGLDEKYVMCSDTASMVLRRRISPREMAEHGHDLSFWSEDLVSNRGSCLSRLRFDGLIQWGSRRQVRFLNPHEEYAFGRSSNDRNTEDGDRDGDDEEEEETVEAVMTRRSSKRKKKIMTTNNDGDKPGSSKRVNLKKQNPSENARSGKIKKVVIKNSIERWSEARYKLAEENMLKIMKEKEAFFGKPILRPALRAEARKLIGDTGLLDHLLKHMTGKLAPGGAERFCRRHNSDGAMEYWIESAELMEIRKQAGVQNPFWTPPSGWKLGDNPLQDPVSANEIKLLKKELAMIQIYMEEENKMITEEIIKMKRSVEEFSFNNPEAMAIHANFDLASVQSDNESAPLLKKVIQKELMGFKSKVEEQLVEFSGCLNSMKGRLGMWFSEMEEPPLALPQPKAKAKPECDENRKGKRSKSEDNAKRIERLKSSFRICKPQSSFMWPNNTLTLTPPSASSTSAPPGVHLLVGPSSPVKPVAEKCPIKPSTLSSLSAFSSAVPPQPETTSSQTLNILINLKKAPDDQNIHNVGDKEQEEAE